MNFGQRKNKSNSGNFLPKGLKFAINMSLVEQSDFSEQYLHMSPRERNVELQKLYGTIPPFEGLLEFLVESSDEQATNEGNQIESAIASYVGNQLDAERRRDGSEAKRIILDRVAALMKYSYICDAGQQFILATFAAAYNVGRPKESLPWKSIPDSDDFLYMVTFIDEEGDGIFGENTIIIEGTLLDKAQKESGPFKKVLDRKYASLTPEDLARIAKDQELSDQLDRMRKYYVLLDEWDKEINQKLR